jgi:hypothetical protein
VLTSRSRKLQLEVRAPGEAHIVLMQTETDGKVWLEGKLVVSLPSPEAITHIKIRVKGIVRTMVMRVRHFG